MGGGLLGKCPLGRPKIYEHKTQMAVKEIGCEGRRWMELAQDHVVILISNGLVHTVTQS
jgi:hypothetical protein